MLQYSLLRGILGNDEGCATKLIIILSLKCTPPTVVAIELRSRHTSQRRTSARHGTDTQMQANEAGWQVRDRETRIDWLGVLRTSVYDIQHARASFSLILELTIAYRALTLDGCDVCA